MGRVADPSTRRFYYSVKFVTVGDGKSVYFDQIDPAAGSNIATFLGFCQYAVYSSLSVHLVPARAAASFMVDLTTAWYPEHETAPNTSALMDKSPTCTRHTIGPPHPGGVPPTLTVPLVEEYGVTSVLKPSPHFGGVPRLALRWELFPLAEHEFTPTDGVWRIVVEAVVNNRPPL